MAWLEKRRLRRQVSAFWELLGEGHVAAALALFDEDLRQFHDFLAPAVRVIYHLLRWLESPRAEHVEAVLSAVREEGVSPGVVRAARIMMHLHRVRARAEAVRNRTGRMPLGEERDEALAGSEPYEHMAVALGLIYALGTVVSVGTHPELGKRLLRELPPEEELSGKARQLRRRLAIWASMLMEDYERVLELVEQTGLIPEATEKKLQLMVADRRLQASISAGAVAETCAALCRLAPLLDLRHLLAYVTIAAADGATGITRLPALVGLLERAEGLLIERAGLDREHGSAWTAGIVFARGLLAIRSGNAVAGRLDVRAAFKAAGSKGFAVRHANAIRAQALVVLMCLQLSEVKTWPRIQGTAEKCRTVIMGNHTLWAKARKRLQVASTMLSRIDHPDASFGHLVVGFISFIDSGRPLTDSQLNLFSSAVAQWEERGSVSRLRSIETALHIRAQATNKALSLIEKRCVAELDDLYRTVLGPLGVTVSPLVRMAVIMTLWDENRIEDAKTVLEEIEVGLEHQPFLKRCLELVHVRVALKSLTAACRSVDGEVPAKGRIDACSELVEMVGLAAAAIHLRRGQWSEALSVLPMPWKEAELHTRISFYGAWMLGDMDRVAQLDARRLVRNGSVGMGNAIAGRRLSIALESADDMRLDSWIREYVVDDQLDERIVLGVALSRLSDGEPKPAARMLMAARRILGEGVDGQRFVEGLVAARLGETTTALAVFVRSDELVGRGWGDESRVEMIVRWGRLFGLIGELAQAVESDDLVQRWPSIRRGLEERALEVDGPLIVQAHVDLMRGMLAYLCSDQMVDEDTLGRLDRARRVLPLERHARFLEDVVSRLTWRRSMLESFWQKLERGDLAECRTIHSQELVPAFGDRLPQSVTLAMLIVDWDQGQEPRALLARMDELERHQGRLPIVQRLRDQIQSGMRLAELGRLVKGRDFTAIVDFVRSTPWPGSERGFMPVPAAIALLYALAQKEENEQALGLGGSMEKAQRLPRWVQDQAALVLGYVRFRARDFDGAATTFEGISTPKLLGHDVDRYWAASHFSRGLELLDADKKSEAFDAFARSVGRRNEEAGGVANLAPLFAHFGLTNIEAESGARALQAFELLQESLRGVTDATGDVLRDRLLARTGTVLCRCLIDDPQAPVEAAEVLGLLKMVERDREKLGSSTAQRFERAILLMGLCQELKLARRDKQPREGLLTRIDEQAKKVQGMVDETKRQEPPLLVLLGMRKLLLGSSGDRDAAFELLGQAMRLGVHSARLTRILQRQEQLRLAAQKSGERLIDLLDVYLASDEIPEVNRQSLSADENVASMYLLNAYRPRDLRGWGAVSGVRLLCERTRALVEYANEEGVESERVVELRCAVGKLEEIEKQVVDLEQWIMSALAARVKNGDQRLEPMHDGERV